MNLELTIKEAKTLLAAIDCVSSDNTSLTHVSFWLGEEEAEKLLDDIRTKIITYFDEVSQ